MPQLFSSVSCSVSSWDSTLKRARVCCHIYWWHPNILQHSWGSHRSPVSRVWALDGNMATAEASQVPFHVEESWVPRADHNSTGPQDQPKACRSSLRVSCPSEPAGSLPIPWTKFLLLEIYSTICQGSSTTPSADPERSWICLEKWVSLCIWDTQATAYQCSSACLSGIWQAIHCVDRSKHPGPCSCKDGKLHPVTYASRALSSSERNYSIMELAILTIVWAISHFHKYLYGNHVTIYMNHSAIKAILQIQTLCKTYQMVDQGVWQWSQGCTYTCNLLCRED